MKLARYMGGGQVAIVEEPKPTLPKGGLLVRTEACGLCSGELMSWYMDKKIPHVLGHEVAGIVEASEDERFPVGSRVFPHHHAPCLKCDQCRIGAYVHCAQWKRTKLVPGGMAEYFAVSAENLNDTIVVDDIRPEDAALIEPLACVSKSVMNAYSATRPAVVGLGVMGLMHALCLYDVAVIAYDTNPQRVEWARSVGIDARLPEAHEPADVVIVCPGSQVAFDFAFRIAGPASTIVMFAPLPPGEALIVPQEAYFKDLTITQSYSCGPDDTKTAANLIRAGRLKYEQVISHVIGIDELPAAYLRMKNGEILKPMVVFDHD